MMAEIDPEIKEEVKDVESQETNTPTQAVEKEVFVPYVPIMSEHSTHIGNLIKALAIAQGSITNGVKGTEGHNYKYMELEAVISIMRKPLADVGLAVIQSHTYHNKMAYTQTFLAHESGEWFKNTLAIPINIMKGLSPAQMIGVSLTYGRRYALQAMGLIAGEKDTDGK